MVYLAFSGGFGLSPLVCHAYGTSLAWYTDRYSSGVSNNLCNDLDSIGFSPVFFHLNM